MQEVTERLYVADDSFCGETTSVAAIIHACKDPCHREAVGYTGTLSKEHEHYLVLESGNDLYLNIIDPPAPLFPPKLFKTALGYLERTHGAGKDVLIHCNQGKSRAPSLALLYMAKRLGELPDDSYMTAKAAFEKLYPAYDPNRGIQTALEQQWRELS